MNLSNKLIDTLKVVKELDKDKEAAELIPNMNAQNISAIRAEKRHLTEEQALWIAETCSLDVSVVLVELAEECAKSEKAKSAWSNLAKKLKAASSVALLAAFLGLLSVSGLNAPQRLKNSP